MLGAKIDEFRIKIESYKRDELIDIAVEYFTLYGDEHSARMESDKTRQKTFEEFAKTQAELKTTKQELEIAMKKIVHLTEVRNEQNQEMYGASSEKMFSLYEGLNDDNTDPIDEDADEPAETEAEKKHSNVVNFRPRTESHKAGRKKTDISKLPVFVEYDCNMEKLNEDYGTDWEFIRWNVHETVEYQKQRTYVKQTLTPVIRIKKDAGDISADAPNKKTKYTMVTIPYLGKLFSGSLASPSLLSAIMCDYCNMYLPLYRQEHDPDRFGFHLSRQTMSNWINRSMDYLMPVYERACVLVKTFRYQQCDETPYLVIMDKKNKKNFIWCHRTSELADVHPVIVYCYESSRAADHLYEFYNGVDEEFYLVCDAYSAYKSFKDNSYGIVILCGCMMHLRRRFVDAIRVKDTKGLSDEVIASLPAMQAIAIIAEIYREENKLKKLPAVDRKEKRLETVKPLYDKLYFFIESIPEEQLIIDEKLKDAVNYAINQKEFLYRFFEDGNLPLDDGATERSIKPITGVRRNSMFSFSIKGATAMTVITSLIETAKANSAEPFYYLQYLLENMPLMVSYGQNINLDDMMPWSEKYRKYEIDCKQNVNYKITPQEQEQNPFSADTESPPFKIA